MLQEVHEGETYFIDIIDSQIIAINKLESPKLPLSLENQDSVGSDRGGSFNNVGRRSGRSSLTNQGSFHSTSFVATPS